MQREHYDHGFAPADREAARAAARQAMIGAARRAGQIAYSDLVAEIRAVDLEPQSPQLARPLGETATDEHAAGRGMLSVVVVHNAGDGMRGSGFFELAETLGHDTRDRVAFWVGELARGHATWA